MSKGEREVMDGEARPLDAAERVRVARRLLDGVAWGAEDLWAEVSLADLPRVRADARGAWRALRGIMRRLGMDGEAGL